MTRYVIKAPIASITSDSRLVEKTACLLLTQGSTRMVANTLLMPLKRAPWQWFGMKKVLAGTQIGMSKYCNSTPEIAGRAYCQSILQKAINNAVGCGRDRHQW